ncbi:MAG: hypothetical protein H0X02_06620 [Nitrosomonas sp.]|nr:hypothetical protein [Nitrosomonas sp.]
MLLPATSTPVALYLTGQLPQENRQGFYLLLLWLKRHHIFVPKDIRKLLFEAIKIIHYNGSKLFRQGEIISPRDNKWDFVIMTAIDDDDAAITINHYRIDIGHEPVLIYLRALDYDLIALSHSDFSVASYSLKDNYGCTQNIFGGLFTVPLNQMLNGQLVTYHIGQLHHRIHEYGIHS